MRKGVQLCSPVDLGAVRGIIKHEGFVLVQPKLKGMHLLWAGGELLSDEGNPLPGLAHISADLASRGQCPVEGEAYIHGLREREIVGRCRRSVPDDETRQVQLHVFDLPGTPLFQLARMKQVAELEPSACVLPVAAEPLDSLGKVRRRLDEYVAAGFEGIVIRDPMALWKPGKHAGCMKWKPPGRDIYRVVDVLCGASPMAAGLVVADAEGGIFRVSGLALNKDQRRALWQLRKQAAGREVVISYSGSGEELEGARVERFWEPWPELESPRPRMGFQVVLPGS